MREICIPVSDFGENEIAEVTLTVGQKKLNYSFRVESFPWSIDDSVAANGELDQQHATLEQIMLLRKSLASYDKGWELIQIFTPSKGASHIQVLYRKRNH